MRKNIIILLCIFASILVLASVYYVNDKLNRIVVVDVIQVFNEFNLKKDLEARVETELTKYTNHLDSLNSLFELSTSRNDIERAKKIKDEINMLEMQVRKTYEISNKKYQ